MLAPTTIAGGCDGPRPKPAGSDNVSGAGAVARPPNTDVGYADTAFILPDVRPKGNADADADADAVADADADAGDV